MLTDRCHSINKLVLFSKEETMKIYFIIIAVFLICLDLL